MSKQCLDIEQMQHLQELGMELKDTMLYWIKPLDAVIGIVVGLENDWQLDFIDDKKKKYLKYIPAYTLQDILDLLPKRIIDEKGFDYFLAIHIYNNIWNVVYSLYNEILVTINYFNSECLIDAAYEMLCWCVENGYIETKNKLYESESKRNRSNYRN